MVSGTHRNDRVGLEALRSSFASDHWDDLVDAPIFLEADTREGKGAAPIPALHVAFKPTEGSHSWLHPTVQVLVPVK